MIFYENAKKSVGPGWHILLKEVYAALSGKGTTVSDVKEKWGRLRISVENADEEILDFIDDIEMRSGHICEDCGKPGHVEANSYGWLMCRCNVCRGADSEGTKCLSSAG